MESGNANLPIGAFSDAVHSLMAKKERHSGEWRSRENRTDGSLRPFKITADRPSVGLQLPAEEIPTAGLLEPWLRERRPALELQQPSRQLLWHPAPRRAPF